ncbi:MAG TPA: pyridoxal phosphate-dependent aminotransferase [Clostridiales bacterium]|jgi:cystathionine beta-lyase|nr:pyridoxal phosphate-dependent aminotransferase [Clostridiales bacterium]
MALQFVDRRGTDSVKWDGMQSMFGRSDMLAMWIADMDFKEPACVTEALRDYIERAAFGYHEPSDGYFQSFIDWEKKYYNYEVKREWMRYSPGIVPAFNWVIWWATDPGDAVILLTPVYYPMIDAVNKNGRKLIQCDLINENMTYSVDFEKFEKDIVDNKVKLFIMSSPHNPVGRAYSPDELRRLMEICRKHDVLVISDEIHQDFVYGEHEHVPTATLGDYDEFLLTMTAPSKTFNLAGLQNSIIIIPDPKLRARWDSFQHRLHMKGGNSIGFVAAEAAYKGGREWLDEVKEQIYSNFVYARDFLAKELPDVGVADLQGTYLMWMDFGKWLKTQEDVVTFFEEKCSIAFDYGHWFGGDKYIPFVRLNLATKREIIEKALQIIVREIKKL